MVRVAQAVLSLFNHHNCFCAKKARTYSHFNKFLTQQRLRVFARGFGLATEHAGDFIDALGAFEKLYFRHGATFVLAFGDDKMSRSSGGNWRQVRDADNLMCTSQSVTFFHRQHRQFRRRPWRRSHQTRAPGFDLRKPGPF